MCTVSFLPSEDSGFHLLMNRDEQRSRPRAHPPRLHSCGKLRGVYPSEPGGGTWIGVNEAGITAALINWYSMPQPRSTAFSRGLIIPTLLSAGDTAEAASFLRALPLQFMAPFRLLLIDTGSRSVSGFSMAGGILTGTHLSWEPIHWYSSGHDESGAEKTRAQAFLEARNDTDAGSLAWLRRIHSSHEPERGPYSLCMHRNDAVTVSFTEVTLAKRNATMVYLDGPPCSRADTFQLSLPLKLRSTDQDERESRASSKEPRTG